MMTLQEYLDIDLFLQNAVIRRRGDIWDFSRARLGVIDVLVLDDWVYMMGWPKDGDLPPRILVIEDMAHDPIMRYPSLAAAAGYRFHRGKIFEVEGRGDVALLEFHRKEPDNAESPH